MSEPFQENQLSPQGLSSVQAIYQKNQKLEAQIEEIKAEIEANHKQLIAAFFPYLLAVYARWRPSLGEKAMAIYFDMHICFEVTIREINGYRVRAQEGQKSVYHRFELNPVLEEYEMPAFIIPMGSYNEIKDLFSLTYLG